MKNFTKKLALLLVFAMVLGVVSPSIVAKADGETKKVYLDFKNLTLQVKAGSTYYADYEFAQLVQDDTPTEEKIKAIKDKDWVLVDGEDRAGSSEDAKGDISWFNKKKASYAVVRFYEGGKYTYLWSDKIEAQTDAFKVLFTTTQEGEKTKNTPAYTSAQAIGSPKSGYLVFYTGKGDAAKVVTPSALYFRVDGSYNYKKVYASTNTFTSGDKRGSYEIIDVLQRGVAKGVTLQFVQMKEDGTATTQTDTKGWPTSKEVKFKLTAQKTAPTVKLDITHVVPLKSGQEYRIVNAADTKQKSAWVKVDDAHGVADSKGKVKVGKVLLEELVVTTAGITVDANKIPNSFIEDGKLAPTALAAGNVEIQVRTAASSKGVASKIYSVVVSQAAIAEDTIGKDVTVAWTVPYDKTKGLTITNKSKDDYEYAFTISGAAVDGNTKWKTVKAEKAAAEKSLQDKDKKDYTVVHVRKVGDKKAGILSSNYADVALATVPSTPQAITAMAGNATSKAITGVTNGTYTYTTAGAVTVTIPVAAVSGAAVAKASVKIPVTGIVKGEIKKWEKKGTNKAFTVAVPEYKDGEIVVTFDVKEKTAANTSDDAYKLKVESLELTFKFEVK